MLRAAEWPVRAVYLVGFGLALRLLRNRADGETAERAARRAIDSAFATYGTPGLRRQVTNVGVLAPMVLCLVPAVLLLVTYPVHESAVVLKSVWVLVAVGVSFSLVQLAHYLASVVDETRWNRRGQPTDWTPMRLARPSAIDTPLWLLLAALVIASTV